MRTLADPLTPFAVIDRTRVERNARRLSEHLDALGVPLRLHVKTAKTPEVARIVFGGGTGPITVSTLAEAEHFACDGFTDIVYAVGIAPDKLQRVLDLLRRGVDLIVLLDSPAQAHAVADASGTAGVAIPALIEIDSDGHRGGFAPNDPALVETARLLHDAAGLRGVLTHAGESYTARSPAELHTAAANERDVAVRAANTLRAHDLPCAIVSVGSTPTAFAATDLAGVTEVRAGNFVFLDLVMHELGVCTADDIALSVVTTVIGHQPSRGWVLTDAGWTAMSADFGETHGYGLVADLEGRLIPGLSVIRANQEHGIVAAQAGSGDTLPDLPVGTRLRIFPHHACATATQHRAYHVIAGERSAEPEPLLTDVWRRADGW
jgi:D-serine deaminase-like pyridoxal phosphate-dependent protein